jgi:O-methyltransferase involved in polyketide biosynthesis
METEVCSHHDIERQGVGQTAHVVAMLRAIETSRKDQNRLIEDHFAEKLAGKIGKSSVLSYFPSRALHFLLSSQLLRLLLRVFSPFLAKYPELGMIDGIPIRTRVIDDELKNSIKIHQIEQICVLGAGLDARPWRFNYSTVFEESLSRDSLFVKTGDVQHLKNVHYFEYDFPEMFRYKHQIIQSVTQPKIPFRHTQNGDILGIGLASAFTYHSVEGDLSLPDWPDKLIDTGFDPNKPSLWILEGFSGYLTEEEFRSLFGTVSERLTAKGSRFIGNFVKPESGILPVTKNMHKFKPPSPLNLVVSYGWTHVKEESFEEAGIRLRRVIYPLHSTNGHVFISASK